MSRRISSASTRISCRSAEDVLPYRDTILNVNFHADFATGCGMPAGTLSAITRSTLQPLHVTDQLLHVTRQHVATGKRVNSFIDGARRLAPSGGQGRSHKPRQESGSQMLTPTSGFHASIVIKSICRKAATTRLDFAKLPRRSLIFFPTTESGRPHGAVEPTGSDRAYYGGCKPL